MRSDVKASSLLDKKGKSLDAYWHITDACSLNCRYCFRPRFSEQLPPPEVSEIPHVLSLWDICSVTITGGEPTEYIALEDELIALNQLGISVSIISNGMHVDMLKSLLERGLLSSASISVHSSNRKYVINRITKLLSNFSITFLVPIDIFSAPNASNVLLELKKISIDIAEQHSVCPLAIEWQEQLPIDNTVLEIVSATSPRFDGNIILAQMDYFRSEAKRTSNCRFLSRTIYISPNGSLFRCFYRAKQRLGTVFQRSDIDLLFLQPECKCNSSGCVCVNQGNLTLF